MTEIEDLQVELESIICVQKLERLIDLAKYFELEIDPEVKTKLAVIKLLRKHIDETIANEPGTISAMLKGHGPYSKHITLFWCIKTY